MKENDQIIEAEFTEVESAHNPQEMSVSELKEALDGPADIQSDVKEIMAADGEIHYADYNMEDVEKYVEHIPTLNYLELTHMRDGIKKSLSTMDELSGLLETLGSMDLKNAQENNLSNRVLQENVLRKNGIADDYATFKENYGEQKAKNTFILEKITATLAEKYPQGEDGQGTIFFTEQMLELLKKRLDKLNPEAPNYAENVRRYETAIKAYANRTDITYIIGYVQKTLANKRTMRQYFKDLRKMMIKTGTHQRPFYMTDLMKGFSDDQLQKVYGYLAKLLSANGLNNGIDLNTMFFIFSRIIKNEQRNGADSYVKVFFLNILDKMSGVYDYWKREGTTEDETTLDTQILYIFSLLYR